MVIVKRHLNENDYIEHHGVDGQQWGVQNGPPYPLSRSAKRRIKREAKLEKKRLKKISSKKIVQDVRSKQTSQEINRLSDEELQRLINRLNLEQKYIHTLNAKERSGQQYIKNRQEKLNRTLQNFKLFTEIGANSYKIGRAMYADYKTSPDATKKGKT